MGFIRNIILGLVIGGVVGLWAGVNIGKEKPIFSNPFVEKTVQDKLKDAGVSVLQKSGELMEKGGEALQDSLDQ